MPAPSRRAAAHPLLAALPALVAASAALLPATWLPATAWADGGSARQAQPRVVSVEVVGLRRTERFVVDRELAFAVGQPVSQAAIDESVIRLRNLPIFRSVRATTESVGDGVRVIFTVDERWTLLPIFAFGRGGALLYGQLGAWESNVAGRLLYLGGQYTYFGGAHGAEVWAMDPRWLGRVLELSAGGGVTNRNRFVYAPDRTILRGYSRQRGRAWVQLRHFFSRTASLALSLDWLGDRFTERLLPDDVRATNALVGFEPPPDQRMFVLHVAGRLGRLRRDDYLFEGGTLDVRYAASARAWGSDATWHRGFVEGVRFWRPSGTWQLVVRGTLGAISSPVVEHQLYVGGLLYRRGFRESEDIGTRMWNVNAEVRVSSVHGRLLALQHVVFFDQGRVATSAAGLVGGALPMGVGTGVRLIAPTIASFVARLDIAYGMGPRAEGFLVSFGSQQFF